MRRARPLGQGLPCGALRGRWRCSPGEQQLQHCDLHHWQTEECSDQPLGSHLPCGAGTGHCDWAPGGVPRSCSLLTHGRMGFEDQGVHSAVYLSLTIVHVGRVDTSTVAISQSARLMMALAAGSSRGCAALAASRPCLPGAAGECADSGPGAGARCAGRPAAGGLGLFSLQGSPAGHHPALPAGGQPACCAAHRCSPWPEPGMPGQDQQC